MNSNAKSMPKDSSENAIARKVRKVKRRASDLSDRVQMRAAETINSHGRWRAAK